jgi:esterase
MAGGTGQFAEPRGGSGMTAELNTQEIVAADASPDRWMAVLHGIFGSGRNWAPVARSLVRARPDWGALLVDLRQHGQSRGFEPPHTLERTAADLAAVSEDRQVRAVMGHSFGGKIALLRGRDDERIQQVWVMDSTPDVSEPAGGPWSVLHILRAVPDQFESRDEAVAALEAQGLERGLALWLATNVERRDDAYVLRLDLDDMEAMLLAFYRTDLWSIAEEPRAGLEIHFVRATGSSVLGAEAIGRIRAAGEATGQVFLHEVQGGHWLNADNPDALVDLMARGLD